MSKYLGDIIKRILEEEGYQYTEKSRTIYTVCPKCGKSDKLSILKENGATICYRGRCQFKGWFSDWLSLSLGISRQAAIERINNHNLIASQKLIKPLQLNLQEETTYSTKTPNSPDSAPLLPIPWPPYDFVPIEHAASIDGQRYLLNRGIPIQIAQYYHLHYSPNMRRVVIPIIINGQYYGWQGRAIDDVDSSLRMRNNTGLRRAELIIFADTLKNSKHVIITEGPFDAMKFFKVGGAVATMGKIVTQQQLQLIMNYGIHTVYLALDNDAVPEMRELLARIALPVYKINIPTSCVQRMSVVNKKADFGECTFDECELAFKTATIMSPYDMALYFNEL